MVDSITTTFVGSFYDDVDDPNINTLSILWISSYIFMRFDS